MLISGPPGIGKTTAAHVTAKLAGYNVIELNASDVRSKKLLEAAVSDTINNTDLHGYFSSDVRRLRKEPKVLRRQLKLLPNQPVLTSKTCLIMDECDGMSGGDRMGLAAIKALIQKTKIPIICIANDVKAQKMKTLTNATFALPFKRPEAKMIRARIMTIAHKCAGAFLCPRAHLLREGLKIPGEVVDQLVQGTQSDIRQVINLLSTYKLSQAAMDFDQGKKLCVCCHRSDLTHTALASRPRTCYRRRGR